MREHVTEFVNGVGLGFIDRSQRRFLREKIIADGRNVRRKIHVAVVGAEEPERNMPIAVNL